MLQRFIVINSYLQKMGLQADNAVEASTVEKVPTKLSRYRPRQRSFSGPTWSIDANDGG
ncbi:uncharacterized protein METZ01_LOCUS3748 [marine metagenome]|uniref:Uncharacterized protein n=1 Tax=marine metagenome TaxID=408172 RepID=A0A381N9Y4_9ZZZZ